MEYPPRKTVFPPPGNILRKRGTEVFGCHAKPTLGAKSCMSVLYQVRPLFSWKVVAAPANVPGLNRLFAPEMPKTSAYPLTVEKESLRVSYGEAWYSQRKP